jgi:hypothetical protein
MYPKQDSLIRNMPPPFLTHFAAQANCSLNNTLDCTKITANSTGTSAGTFGALFFFLGIFILIAVVCFMFWILSLVHVIKHADVKNRIAWLIIILLVPFGGIIYFVAILRPYNIAHPYIPNRQQPENSAKRPDPS